MTTQERLLRSPSMQKKYDRCHLLGQLQYIDRWEPREAERSLPPRLRGNAFALAAEITHKTIQANERDLLNQTSFVCHIVDEAIGRFDRQFQYCVDQGISFRENTDAISRAELRRVIPLYIRHTPVLSWKKVVAVETPIKAYSCRPDLGGVNHLDFACVGDIKYKSKLETEYESSTIEEFHQDGQFLQYNDAWRHDQALSQDVPVYSILLLVVGAPFRIKSVEWLYTPERLQLWRKGAEDLSATINNIEAGLVLPRPSLTHRDNFGWCPMKKACLELNLDPELMKRDYVQLKELPD